MATSHAHTIQVKGRVLAHLSRIGQIVTCLEFGKVKHQSICG